MRPFLLSLLLLTACSSAAAAWPNDDRFLRSVDAGEVISGGIVTALVQGPDGLIWIGTQQGLVRYDGYTFERFRFDPDKPDSLAGNYVRSLAFAKDGRLWIGTLGNGVSIYDAAKNAFKNHVHIADGDGSPANDRVDALAADADGGMWIGTNGGLDYVAPGSNTFVHFAHGAAGTPNDDRIRSLLIDRRGDLWVGSWSGLNRRRAGSDRFEDLGEADPSGASLHGRNVLRLYEDSAGQVWFGTPEHGGGWIEPDSARVEWLLLADGSDASLANAWVTGVADAGNGELWMATYGGGVHIIDLATHRIIGHLRHDASLRSSVGSDEIAPLMVDRSGLLWVGTWGAGLQTFNTRNTTFRMIHASKVQANALSLGDVQSVMVARDGIVWVGTAGNGIDLLDMERGVVGGYRVDKGKPGALTNGIVTAMAQSRDGTVWAGTRQGGVFRRDPGQDRFRHYTSEQGLIDNYVHRLLPMPDGSLWIGTSGGLNHFDPVTETFTTVSTEDQPAAPFAEQIDALARDPAGNLWIGGETGLFVLGPGAERLQRIAHDPADPTSLSNDDVNAMLVDRAGTLWLSTARGFDRLKSWDRSHAVFESISQRVGVPGDSIGTNIMQDKQGRIWADVHAMIDPSDWRLHEFDEADGFRLGVSWIRSYAQLGDGRMLFGGSEGIAVVDADRLQEWHYDPPIVITELSVEGVPLRPANQVELPAETRSFSVGFAALDYSDPKSNRYQFRLDPYDRDWIDTPATRRIATYTHLDPGAYTLKVRGSNRVGDWASQPLSIAIRQQAAWYQAQPFRVAVALAILFAFYLIYRLRVRQLQAQRRALDAKVRERTADLQLAMHQLEEASFTDPLTGLRNRRFLGSHIGPDIEAALRSHRGTDKSGGGDLVFFLLDIDRFKSVNDTYGHAAGDAVLVQFAALLRSEFRESDVIVRWGGEEFLVVSRFADANGAAEVAERLRHKIASHRFVLEDGRHIERTVSIGFAAFPFVPGNPKQVSWEQVIDIADIALLAAKRSRRDAWVGLSPRGDCTQEDVESLFQARAQAIESVFRIETSIEPGKPLRWS
ncbi:MAG: diguanylate cyclase [Xanthomonadales bacterium]|nr:diguanylate cyclase [Xanthomonadales bacterium]